LHLIPRSFLMPAVTRLAKKREKMEFNHRSHAWLVRRKQC
jgi:hypothetical protein